MTSAPSSRSAGFTLLELLTTMIVIGILSGIAAPYLRDATERAAARKVLTDVAAVRVAVLQFREDEGRLPARARWRTVPPDLEPYLNDVGFAYEDVEYRLRTRTQRGRVDFEVRYPRGSGIGSALRRFARPGRTSGSVAWSARRMRFRLLEDNL